MTETTLICAREAGGDGLRSWRRPESGLALPRDSIELRSCRRDLGAFSGNPFTIGFGMSWFKREDGEFESEPGPGNDGEGCGEKNVRTEGLVDQVPGMPRHYLEGRPGCEPECVPQVPAPLQAGRAARVDLLLEPGYELFDTGLKSTDPLNFTDVKPYKQRLRAAREQTGLNDAILNAVGQLGPHSVVLSAMEYAFIGGSMGAVVGETIARAVDRAR